MKTTAVIAAAGRGVRMGAAGNKVFLPVLGRPMLAYTLDTFLQCDFVDEIIIITRQCDLEQCRKISAGRARVLPGGETRQESVWTGLQAASGELVLIHDGARALVTPEIIRGTWEAAQRTGAAAVGVGCKDTLKAVDADGWIANTIDRDAVWQVQTPQAFRLDVIRAAHQQAIAQGFSATDDCALAERCGIPVKMVMGSYENIKLTTPEDLAVAEQILKKRGYQKGRVGMRIGQGYDVHRLTQNRDLILCGVQIPYELGLLGHSDADVALHALADALLGAAALGDIGKHFPDTDPQYQGASSMDLLDRVVQMVREQGYQVSNADVTLICQRPKLAPFILQMQENTARVLRVAASQVNIKATTTEKLGFTGRGEGISAMAVVLLQEKDCTDAK